MYERLTAFLKAPALWERSAAPFWDDDHISKGMLAAHLNPAIDAASRRADTIERSVRWLASLIRPPAKWLDLGCGPGLYTSRLSDLGFSMTGVDYSRRSIAFAKAHDGKTTYRLQNYLDLDDRGIYDAVTLIYCDYAALTLPERQRLLARVYRALRPGGLFVFDVFTDAHFKKLEDASRWTLWEHGGFFSGQPHILMDAAYRYEHDTVRANRHTVIAADHITDHIIWDSAFTLQRLTAEITPAGFAVRAACDDICASPYTGAADTLCVVAEKR